MMSFYISVDCPECDEEVIYGPCVTAMEHDGLPVIPYDMAGQTMFDCEGCGAKFSTGDFDLFSESEM